MPLSDSRSQLGIGQVQQARPKQHDQEINPGENHRQHRDGHQYGKENGFYGRLAELDDSGGDDAQDRRLEDQQHVLNLRQVTIRYVEVAQPDHTQRPGHDEGHACKRPTDISTFEVTNIDGQLQRLRPRKQMAECHDFREAVFGEPTLLLDHVIEHHRNLRDRTSYVDEAQEQKVQIYPPRRREPVFFARLVGGRPATVVTQSDVVHDISLNLRWVVPFAHNPIRSFLFCGCLDVVEARHGVGFGPEPHLARLEGIVMRLDHQLSVQKAAYGVTLDLHPQLLPGSGWHLGRAFLYYMAAPADVFVDIDVVFQGIGPQDIVVVTVLDAKDDAGCPVRITGDGLEAG